MASRSDLSDDFEKLKRDATQMEEENARLRSINAKMLAALRYLSPLLQCKASPRQSISTGRKKPSPRSKMPSLKQNAIPKCRSNPGTKSHRRP